jgi:hypothetical protein
MTRFFCTLCSTPVYNESHLEDYPFKDIPAGVLDRNEAEVIAGLAKEAYQPQCHMFYGSRQLDVKDTLPKWTGFPGMSDKYTEG